MQLAGLRLLQQQQRQQQQRMRQRSQGQLQLQPRSAAGRGRRRTWTTQPAARPAAALRDRTRETPWRALTRTRTRMAATPRHLGGITTCRPSTSSSRPITSSIPRTPPVQGTTLLPPAPIAALRQPSTLLWAVRTVPSRLGTEGRRCWLGTACSQAADPASRPLTSPLRPARTHRAATTREPLATSAARPAEGASTPARSPPATTAPREETSRPGRPLQAAVPPRSRPLALLRRGPVPSRRGRLPRCPRAPLTRQPGTSLACLTAALTTLPPTPATTAAQRLALPACAAPPRLGTTTPSLTLARSSALCPETMPAPQAAA
mmetsp:Transcript_19050/g.72803  ORF Transcript_19050/g.72803 Transcript_19050/m.72803 type:complete len:320 (-) Transcript_19050:370-1329(-)